MEFLFLLGRVLFGGYFFLSGLNHFKHSKMMTSYAESKGVPTPKNSVLLTGLMLVLGGLGIVLGVYYEIALWLIVIFLLVVTFKMHAFWKESTPEAKMSEKRDFMKNMALLGAVLIIISLPVTWIFTLI